MNLISMTLNDTNLQHKLNSSQFDESVDWFPATAEVHQLEQAFNVFAHLQLQLARYYRDSSKKIEEKGNLCARG